MKSHPFLLSCMLVAVTGALTPVSLGWKGSGVVDGVTQGLWSTSYVGDGSELKGESQYNGSTVGTTWTVWSEGERVVTTYSAPDGSVTSKDADATNWSELEYGDYTGTGTGRPGMPHCMTRKDDSGITWDWTANVDGSTVVEVREGLLDNGAVTQGTMSVSTTNGRGYVTDVEGILVQGEEELKVSGSSTPVGQFTTWGAPLKSTDYTTGLSDIRAYDGNLERLVSHTDPLEVTTAVTARDSLGRVTGYNWKGHTGTVTPGALSVGNSINMGGGASNPSSTRTWDAMGRMLSDNQTVGGVTHARGATYNANTRTIETSNSLTGAGTSSTVNNSTNALAATGSVLPFGGVTGEDLSVENGLLLTKSKLTGKTNTYQSTCTDVWGRVRKTVTPSTASTGEDTTEYVYSDPGSHIHRVTTLELSGRRTIQESDPYNTAGAITRSGVDVNLDANGGYSLDDSDRYVLTTVTLDEGVLHTEVKATGEPTGNGPATRTILITDTDPVTGIVTAIPNPTDDPAVSGGEETITQQPDYEHNKVTTTSTKGWENTDTFNSLGLPTKKVLSGTGLAGSTLNSTWRDDGTLASASMIAGDPETGATSTASLGNNGLLTGLTVPLLGNIFGGHSFTNGTESITLNGTIRTASLDGTSTSATGTDIMGQTRNVVVDGSTFKNTIAPTVGANTVLTHNAAGAKTTHDYIAGPGIATTWNAGWELASISNGRGGSAIFEYSQDGARDLTDITYPGAGTFSAIHEEFTHYPSGKVKTISDPSGSRLLTYDRSRLWQSTYVNVGKALDGYEVERTTDAAGRLETVTVKHKGTVIHSYTNSFNANSHEISGVDATGFSSSYNRANPDTRAITKITRGTVEQNWGRGTAGRITSAGSSISDVPITDAPSFAYTEFDSKGRRKKCTTAGFTWEYTYGTAGQLTAAEHPTLGNFSYPVDGIGRRTGSGSDSRNRFMAMAHSQQKQLIISAATTARLYINETEMTPFTGGWFFNIPSPGQDGGWVPWVVKGVLEDAGDHEPNDDAIAEVAGITWVPPANEAFTYDDDGNRESSSLWDYGWDGRNMLVSATTKNYSESPEGWRVTCDYDAEGRRFKKTIIHKTTRAEQVKETLDNVTFIWDGWNLIYERHANELGTRTLDRKYVWGEDIGGGTGGASGAGGAGGLLLIRETRGQAAPVDYYPLYDGSGHVVGLTDSAGTLVAQYTYGPFGELISASGPMADANPIRYATKYFDKETGLYYYGRRYYDPATGQWLNREPLGENESLNLYAYAGNDPINNVDALGLEAVPVEPVLRNGVPTMIYEEWAGTGLSYLWNAAYAKGVKHYDQSPNAGQLASCFYQEGGAWHLMSESARHNAGMAAAVAAIPGKMQEIKTVMKTLEIGGAATAAAPMAIAAAVAAGPTVLAAAGEGSLYLGARGTTFLATNEAVLGRLAAGGTLAFLYGASRDQDTAAAALSSQSPMADIGVGLSGVRLLAQDVGTVSAAAWRWAKPGMGNALESYLYKTGGLAYAVPPASRTTPAIADGTFYSTAFETQLSPTSYPGVTAYMHFKEANIALDTAIQTNPLLSDLGIIIPRSRTGTIIGEAPNGWAWHHDIKPGVLQLVPKSQHPNIPGGIFWETLHPNGKGGMSLWGGGYTH